MILWQLTLLLFAQVPAPVSLNASEIVANVLNHRRAITSGQFMIDSTLRQGELSAEYSWTIYFTGNNIRQDTKKRFRAEVEHGTDSYVFHPYACGK